METNKQSHIEQIIEELLPLEESDLLVFLGNQEFRTELAANSWSPLDLIKKVREWLQAHWPDIREKVCKNEIVRKEIIDGKLEKKLLISHVAVLLTGIWHTHVTVAAIAVYIVNFGFKKICNENIS